MESLYKIKVQNTHFSVLTYEKPYTTDAPAPVFHPATLHEHPVYEVFFIREGEVAFHTETDVAIHADSVVIIPPHLKHRTVPKTRDTLCISFSPLQKDARSREVEVALGNALQNAPRALPLGEELRFYTTQILRTSDAEERHHLFSLLFTSLLRTLLPKEYACDTHDHSHVKYITTIEDFLAKRCYQKVRLGDLAAVLSLSEKQTARLFKRIFGCTLSERIHRLRMENAVALLQYTDLDIREIATSLGYEYENYFYARFRKHYGTTPIEYRQTHLLVPLDEGAEK